MFLCEQPSWSFGWLIVGLAPQTAQNGRLFDAYKRAKREGSAQSLEMFVVRKPWGEQKNLIYLKAFFLVQLCWSAKRATRSESTKNYNYTMYKEQKGFGILELCSLLLCVFFCSCSWPASTLKTPPWHLTLSQPEASGTDSNHTENGRDWSWRRAACTDRLCDLEPNQSRPAAKNRWPVSPMEHASNMVCSTVTSQWHCVNSIRSQSGQMSFVCFEEASKHLYLYRFETVQPMEWNILQNLYSDSIFPCLESFKGHTQSH
jgi:hypothetical protein